MKNGANTLLRRTSPRANAPSVMPFEGGPRCASYRRSFAGGRSRVELVERRAIHFEIRLYTMCTTKIDATSLVSHDLMLSASLRAQTSGVTALPVVDWPPVVPIASAAVHRLPALQSASSCGSTTTCGLLDAGRREVNRRGRDARLPAVAR